MKKFTFEIWFLRGNEQKDFDHFEVISENYESALESAKKINRFTRSIKLLKEEKIHGEEV